MKTHIKQVVIIVSLFSLAMFSTLTVSWGVNSLFYQGKQFEQQKLAKIVRLKKQEIKAKLDLGSTFSLLIPKVK